MTTIWDGAAPREVRLYAPIRMGFRLDLGAYLAAVSDPDSLAARIKGLEKALNAAVPPFLWRGPEPLVDSGPATIGHRIGRAPSHRPAFFLSSDWRKPGTLRDVTADQRRVLALAAPSVRLTVQDFGVAIAEIRCVFDAAPVLDKPLDYAARLNDLVTACTDWLAAYAPRLMAGIDQVLVEDGAFHRPAFMPATAPVEPATAPAVYWIHGLTLMEADGRSLMDSDWSSALAETGEFPLRGHPIDAIVRMRGGRLVSLPTRDLDLGLLLGWGYSFGIVKSRRSSMSVDEAAPTDFVLHLSQAFNAALFDLNRAVLAETSRLVSQGAEAGHDLRRLIETLDHFQEEMNLLVSLLSEQRFCLSAIEHRVWDGTLEVWGTERLINDLTTSLQLFKGAVQRRQRDRDERRNRRITAAVTVITVSSAAALLYDMIPNILEAETPSRAVLVIQMGILVGFMAMAWTLVRDARRARKARRRNSV